MCRCQAPVCGHYFHDQLQEVLHLDVVSEQRMDHLHSSVGVPLADSRGDHIRARGDLGTYPTHALSRA